MNSEFSLLVCVVELVVAGAVGSILWGGLFAYFVLARLGRLERHARRVDKIVVSRVEANPRFLKAAKELDEY